MERRHDALPGRSEHQGRRFRNPQPGGRRDPPANAWPRSRISRSRADGSPASSSGAASQACSSPITAPSSRLTPCWPGRKSIGSNGKRLISNGIGHSCFQPPCAPSRSTTCATVLVAEPTNTCYAGTYWGWRRSLKGPSSSWFAFLRTADTDRRRRMPMTRPGNPDAHRRLSLETSSDVQGRTSSRRIRHRFE